MKIHKQIPFLFLIFFLYAQNSFALKFANQFVEFELPNIKWKCDLDGSEWVCQSNDEQKKREAIIVLAAKLRSDQDSLDKYQSYLNTPRKFVTANNQSLTSVVKWSKVTKINEHDWVDSLHLASEIPDFYTRYIATVKNDIGVLVTFSIKKDKYQDYLTEFDGMVKSLKVFRKSNLNANATGNLFNQVSLPSSFTGNKVYTGSDESEKPKKPKKEEENNGMLILVLLAGVGGFLYLKKRRR